MTVPDRFQERAKIFWSSKHISTVILITKLLKPGFQMLQTQKTHFYLNMSYIPYSFNYEKKTKKKKTEFDVNMHSNLINFLHGLNCFLYESEWISTLNLWILFQLCFCPCVCVLLMCGRFLRFCFFSIYPSVVAFQL